MTLKNQFLAVVLFATAILASCSKDSTSPTNTGGGVKDTTYFPLQVGYWWDYKAYLSSTLDRTSITKETTINGKNYFVQVSSEDTTRPQYFRYANHVVYSIGPNNPYAIVKDSEFVFLDFNAPVGTTNVYQGYSFGSAARRTVTLEEKGTTYSASNGTVYKDVIVYSILMEINTGGSWGKFSDYSYYYAKGVGLVGEKQSGMLTMSELSNYSFK